MGLLEEVENDVHRKHQELCRNLNLDSDSANQAWESYESIKQNYTLEGEQLHWLGCALYVACRKVSTPSVGHSDTVVQGNGVNLTRLLRLCNLSLIEFFNKSKKWCNMAIMPSEFVGEIERLERNFEVSTVIFKKYQSIFYDIFLNNSEETPRFQRSRKQRRVPCTSNKIFEFCWILFIYVKGKNPEISADLVYSYYFLLACCDLMFGNVIVADRRDLLNPKFIGLPSNWSSLDYVPPRRAPCIIEALCKKHEAGLHEEEVLAAKVTKEYRFKQHITDLINDEVLRANLNTFLGLLDQEVFDNNLKSLNREYEAYVLNKGDFDERIFLAECRRLRKLRDRSLYNVHRPVLQEIKSEDDANIHIGSPARLSDFSEQLQTKRNRTSEEGVENQSTVPDTPYTGRCYLRGRRESPAGASLVTLATSSVSHLRTLLSGRSANPSAELMTMFEMCENNPQRLIETKLNDLGEMFLAKYPMNTNENSTMGVTFARQRLELAKVLFYKLLEDIIADEKRKKGDCSCNVLLNQVLFHHCLFAACVEIVLFSYNSQKKFPWVLETLNLDGYYFYKVIEPIVSIKDHLSRDLVKHLNNIEEQILQSLAWRSDSPLWEQIASSNLPIPSCGDCTIPPAINDLRVQIKQENDTVNQNQVIVQTSTNGSAPSSPNSLPSTSERFQSPVASTYIAKNATRATIKPGQSLLQNQTTIIKPMYLTIPGGDKLIPFVIQPKANPPTVIKNENQKPPETNNQERRATRGGSLALFFRKFYNLASVRMTYLCNELRLTNQELRQKIWTCFEHAIINKIELMKDRHLDQILMCTVYVVCKVAGPGTERTFTDIMRCYRSQPQSASHVYRSVLLTPRNNNPQRNETDEQGVLQNNQQTNNEEAGQRIVAPLTPNQLSGTARNFANGVRGDLIKFYNTIYVQKMKNFALRFSGESAENLPLSPLPTKVLTASPTRRVSDKVYVKSLNKSIVNQSPGAEPLVYCFSRSPAKDLREINKMINLGNRVGGKRRLLNDNENEEEMSSSVSVQKKIRGLFNDRLIHSKDKDQ